MKFTIHFYKCEHCGKIVLSSKKFDMKESMVFCNASCQEKYNHVRWVKK